MKKTGKIIAYIFAALIIVFSLVFIVFETRTLFSGDWLLYENKFNGFIRYFLRLLIAIYTLFIGISTYFVLSKKNNNETLSIYFRFGVLAFLTSSIIISCFASNYIDILFIVLPLLYTLGIVLYFYGETIIVKGKSNTSK